MNKKKYKDGRERSEEIHNHSYSQDTHPRKHTLIHSTHSPSLSVSFFLSLSLSHTHSPTLSLHLVSLSHTNTHTHPLTHTLSFSLSLTHTLSLTHSLSLTHTHLAISCTRSAARSMSSHLSLTLRDGFPSSTVIRLHNMCRPCKGATSPVGGGGEEEMWDE